MHKIEYYVLYTKIRENHVMEPNPLHIKKFLRLVLRKYDEYVSKRYHRDFILIKLIHRCIAILGYNI